MNERLALGAAWVGLGTSTSYMVQRLLSALGGELPASSIIASRHIPYYWRVDAALLQGILLALLITGFTQDTSRGLDVARRVALLVVPFLVLTALCVP